MSFLDTLFAQGGVSNTKPKIAGPLPSTPTTPQITAGTASSSTTVPPGFTAQQWKQLLNMAKNNPSIDALIKQYTSGSGSTDDAWRRKMPTDTSQLLKQLSYNAGEIGMPGGYVGAVQLPAYGSNQPPVNNPDMSKYGQAPGIGEASFYQQSVNGGMAPIAAMSPLGVPAGWNPGGSSDIKSQLDDYLKNLGNGGKGKGAKGGSMKQQLQSAFDAFLKNNTGGFNGVFAGFPSDNPRQGKKSSGGGSSGGGSGVYTNWPGTEHPGTGSGTGTGNTANRGVPISLPFGY